MCVRWRAGGRVVLLSVWRSGQRARPLCPMAGEKGGKGEWERYQNTVGVESKEFAAYGIY